MSKKFIEFLNEADKNEVLYVGTKKKWNMLDYYRIC